MQYERMEYDELLQLLRADKTVLQIEHPTRGVCLVKVDPTLDLDCKACISDLITSFEESHSHTFTASPSRQPGGDRHWRKKQFKKGSLKPSKPLTDEQRDQLFGNSKSPHSSEYLHGNPAAEKTPQKKRKTKNIRKKGKRAPNAIRKSKKPCRL